MHVCFGNTQASFRCIRRVSCLAVGWWKSFSGLLGLVSGGSSYWSTLSDSIDAIGGYLYCKSH